MGSLIVDSDPTRAFGAVTKVARREMHDGLSLQVGLAPLLDGERFSHRKFPDNPPYASADVLETQLSLARAMLVEFGANNAWSSLQGRRM